MSYLRRPAFLLLLAAILALSALRRRLEVWPHPSFLRFRFAAEVSLRGRVVSAMREDHQGRKAVVLALELEGRPFGQRVLAHFKGEVPFPGQMVRLRGLLRLPRRARNPGEFDERALLAQRGVAWVFRVESLITEPETVGWRWRLWFWAEKARRSMEDSMARYLPETQSRLAAGLALGYKGPLATALNRSIQDAGVMHLLVPSGAKVAFVLLGVFCCCRALGLSRAGRFLSAALVGGFYTVMAGGEAPYARAYLGGLVLMAAPLLDRGSDSFQAMTLSALAILACDPRQLYTAGFQMTYLAVFGLVLGMPRFHSALPPSFPGWAKRLAGLGAVSVIVQAMLWPVFAEVFARGSAAGLLANLILVPASGVLMAGAFLVWALSAWQAAAAPAAWLLGRLLFCFVEICRWFAALPGAAVDLMPMSASGVVVYFLFVFAVLILPERRTAAVLAAAGALLWSTAAAYETIKAPELRLVVMTLPRGKPSLLTFKGNRHWLIDPCGPAGAVLKGLRAYGVQELEKIIVAGERDDRAVRTVKSAFPSAEVAAIAALQVCRDEICAQFGGPHGPSVRKGEAEYSIIASRLKASAVEVAVDGKAVRIREAR